MDTEKLIERLAGNYNSAYPDRPPLCYTDRWLYGIWNVGNDYRNKTRFYGAYPNSILKRYEVMFGVEGDILHLFSGSLSKNDYTRFDLRQKADIYGDAHELGQHFKSNTFDIVYADPPYSEADAVKYETSMINRHKVIKQVYKVLRKGGLLVWLDTVYPMHSKNQFKCIGEIGLVRSTNHRVRMIFIFKKV